MDLLSTVLRAADADKFTEHFKKNKIDHTVLKLLSEEDLIAIGINDQNKRKTLLEHIEKLQIPMESKIKRIVDNQYNKLVLINCNKQIYKHYLNLIFALKKDVGLCDIQLTPVINCLEQTVNDFDEELDNYAEKVFQVRPKRKRCINILLPTIAATFLTLFLCRYYIVYSK